MIKAIIDSRKKPWIYTGLKEVFSCPGKLIPVFLCRQPFISQHLAFEWKGATSITWCNYICAVSSLYRQKSSIYCREQHLCGGSDRPLRQWNQKKKNCLIGRLRDRSLNSPNTKKLIHGGILMSQLQRCAKQKLITTFTNEQDSWLQFLNSGCCRTKIQLNFFLIWLS